MDPAPGALTRPRLGNDRRSPWAAVPRSGVSRRLAVGWVLIVAAVWPASDVILERLRERVRTLQPGLAARIEGDALSVAGGELRVRPEVEAILRDGADWIVDVRFAVEIAGAAPGRFAHSIVGIGSDRDAADRSAADDWAGSVGFALLNAHARLGPARSSGAYEAYAGLPGSRGVVPVGWVEGSDTDHTRILDALAPVFQAAAERDWATVSVLYMRGGTAGASVDCHVDGSRSDACQAALLGLAWPEASGFDMLKQVYVLRRVGPVGPDRGSLASTGRASHP